MSIGCDGLEHMSDLLGLKVLHDEDDDFGFLEKFLILLALALQVHTFLWTQTHELILEMREQLLVNHIVLLAGFVCQQGHNVKALRVLFLEYLVESHPLCVSSELNSLQIVIKTMQLHVFNALEGVALFLQFVEPCSKVGVDATDALADDILLLIDSKLIILFLDFFDCAFVNFEQLGVLFCEQGLLILVNLVGYMFAHVYKVAGALVGSVVSKCGVEHVLFKLHRYIMIVQLPPHLFDSIIHVTKVMALFGHSIVYHDGVQVVRPFIGADVWLLESLLHLNDLLCHSLDLVFCFLLHFFQSFECDF